MSCQASITATTPADEHEEQKRWRLRPQYADWTYFDQLVDIEFWQADQLQLAQQALLRQVVEFASENVPYYTEQFSQRRLRPAEVIQPENWQRLPVLSKAEVIEHNMALRSRRLPHGQRLAGETRSSGTTGIPVRVLGTRESHAMFSYLWQRQARWFRLDPFWTMVDVRSGREVCGRAPGQPAANGELVRRDGWRYLGRYFYTGEEYGFSTSNPVERQLAWLESLQPQVLHTYPGTLEELALGKGGRIPAVSLRGLISIGAQLTTSLREQLESIYQVPIQQTYGLNEIGKVGLRCAAGRYHVHAEHCLVEIVDAAGAACPPGATGRVVVTSLRNWAMPLLRYDTGDLAESVAGPCPCGRTLPAFGAVAGRFRRFHGLPAGTRRRVNGLLAALQRQTPEAVAFLREYQLVQTLDNQFTLKVRTVSPPSAEFVASIQRAWAELAKPSMPLRISIVDEIARSPSGKHLDFTSEFYHDDYGRPVSG